MSKRFPLTGILLALASVGLLFACEPKVIPGTQIQDTPETRSLATLVVEKYRRAMEAREADTIAGMCSPRFHETGGTPGAEDDYNLDGLKKRLAEKFKRIKAMTLDIVLIDINIDEEKQPNTAAVKYHYFLKYLVEFPHEEKWETQSEDAQMLFTLENAEWKVTSGL
ncbi:MAG: hypothetical protein HY897_26290 [Deltaproteobacteria bacterium]|nr:hypothetical protein [Deltaproteobacteria bacterium]